MNSESIEEIERGPAFKSKKYVIVDGEGRDKDGLKVDPVSAMVPVKLEFPDNVIVVASRSGKAPPKAAGEKRVAELETAMKRALLSQKSGFRGCSIVVHAGEYALEPFDLGENGRAPGFSIEIIGIEDVRILNQSPENSVLDVGDGWDISLKNLAIESRSGTFTKLSAAILVIKAKLSLCDVRLIGSQHVPLASSGSELRVIDCAFSGFATSFLLESETKAQFQNCLWLCSNSSAIASRNGGVVKYESKVTIFQCRFISKDADSEFPACPITIQSRGRIVMTESSMEKFSHPIVISDSNSKVVLNRCKLLNCKTAIRSTLNATVTVTNCFIAADSVLLLDYSKTGKIQLQRNAVRPRHCSVFDANESANFGPAVILADREPNVVDHDFENVVIRRVETENPLISHPMVGATKESREKQAQLCEDKKMPSIVVGMKMCLHCGKNSQANPEVRFKYCSNCRRVAYCSNECEDANWTDHKLVCLMDLTVFRFSRFPL